VAKPRPPKRHRLCAEQTEKSASTGAFLIKFK
jgi:hypothetical protein